MELGLEGKACVVTGAGSGIGRDVASRLCAEGARVLLVGRTEQALFEAAEEAGGRGGKAEPFVQDVTEPSAGDAIVAAARAAIGGVDVIVNNAGTASWRNLDDVPDADWNAAWELYVMAPMRLMRAGIPLMRERGWGRIVNVASTAGKRPSAKMPEYSVAKAAQLSLSRLYADLHAKEGILVNAVAPGPTKSEMWIGEGGLADQSRALSGLGSREEALEEAAGKRPIGRLAEVGEIGAVITFLCSEQASYVAGAAWSVDGGTVGVIL